MKKTQTLLLVCLAIAMLTFSCSKDQELQQEEQGIPDNITETRSGTGEFCNLIPLFCSGNISTLPHYPSYSLNAVKQGGGGSSESGLTVKVGNSEVEVFHYWMSDESLAFYIVDGNEEYVIHQSDDNFAKFYSDAQPVSNELTRLFELDLQGVSTKAGFAQKLSQLSNVNSTTSANKTIFTVNTTVDNGEVHGLIRGCKAIRYSAVENFIAQFTDHSGLGASHLPGIIEEAFNSCGEGYADPCNNCVDPRCVIDQLISDETGALANVQKELMVAKYLELALGWDEDEFDFFTSGQANRDYMMNLYTVGSSLDACDHITTIKAVFDESLCDITADPDDYKDCIENEVFKNFELFLEDNPRKIDLCEVLECFDILQDDPDGFYEITIYVDQPVAGTRDAYNAIPTMNVGHTFIGIKSVINNVTTSVLFGFYPAGSSKVTPKNPSGFGEFRDDGIGFGDDGTMARDYNTKIVFTVDVSTFNSFISFVKDTACDGIPDYNLDSYNCTDLVVQLFEDFGLVVNFPSTAGSWPGGGGSNPGDFAEDIKSDSWIKPSNSEVFIDNSRAEQPVNCI